MAVLVIVLPPIPVGGGREWLVVTSVTPSIHGRENAGIAFFHCSFYVYGVSFTLIDCLLLVCIILLRSRVGLSLAVSVSVLCILSCPPVRAKNDDLIGCFPFCEKNGKSRDVKIVKRRSNF